MPIPKKSVSTERLSAKELVLQTLTEWIIDGTLMPGEKISDLEISTYFNVSRTPVREALQLLAEQRLVETIPARGTKVMPIDMLELRHIYELFSNLQGIAVKLAFPRITEEFLEQLDKINQQLHDAILREDYDAAQLLDQQFHEHFITLADNPFLTTYIHQLAVHTRRAEKLYFNAVAQSAAGHRHILDALREKNCANAVSYMIDNWMSSIENAENKHASI